MELEQILNQISAYEKQIKDLTKEEKYKSNASRHLAVESRQLEIEKLKTVYKNNIVLRLAGMFVSGKYAKEFAILAEIEGGVIVAHADRLYWELSNEAAFLGGRQGMFSPSQMNLVNIEVTKLCQELGESAPPLVFPGEVQIKCSEDLISVVRNMIRSVMGDRLNERVLRRRIESEAMDKGLSGNVIPVAIIGATKEESRELSTKFPRGFIDVEVKRKPTQKNVIKTFETLLYSCRSNRESFN